jgi:hypothetical protein
MQYFEDEDDKIHANFEDLNIDQFNYSRQYRDAFYTQEKPQARGQDWRQLKESGSEVHEAPHDCLNSQPHSGSSSTLPNQCNSSSIPINSLAQSTMRPLASSISSGASLQAPSRILLSLQPRIGAPVKNQLAI